MIKCSQESLMNRAVLGMTTCQKKPATQGRGIAHVCLDVDAEGDAFLDDGAGQFCNVGQLIRQRHVVNHLQKIEVSRDGQQFSIVNPRTISY
jgi:hypothetical protein